MKLFFSKYSGNGNDFIIIDNRQNTLTNPSPQMISQLCERKRSIGADGVLLLKKSETLDYKMVYFNSDGKEASMCGNGARCLAHFYHTYILKKELEKELFSYQFETQNGQYSIQIKEGKIQIEMSEIYDENKFDLNSISELLKYQDKFYINTGVPHLVLKVNNIDQVNVDEEGRRLRHLKEFVPEGANVNFFQEMANKELSIRTYERGVEQETLACGTGTVATALFYSQLKKQIGSIQFRSPGGKLEVEISPKKQAGNKVLLSGTVKNTFNGSIEC